MTTNYYTVLDNNNLPTGTWYNDSTYPPNADGSRNSAIPTSAVEVDGFSYNACQLFPGKRAIVDGQAVLYTPAQTQADYVDRERDRRINGGYTFSGNVYQTDASSTVNLLGAVQLASLAIGNGAKAGDLRWGNPSADFYWIAANNSHVTMDAQTVVLFGTAVASFRSALVYAARSIKDQLAAGTTVDFYSDQVWGYGANGVPVTSSTTSSS